MTKFVSRCDYEPYLNLLEDSVKSLLPRRSPHTWLHNQRSREGQLTLHCSAQLGTRARWRYQSHVVPDEEREEFSNTVTVNPSLLSFSVFVAHILLALYRKLTSRTLPAYIQPRREFESGATLAPTIVVAARLTAFHPKNSHPLSKKCLS
jgi:hypothetical protein